MGLAIMAALVIGMTVFGTGKGRLWRIRQLVRGDVFEQCVSFPPQVHMNHANDLEKALWWVARSITTMRGSGFEPLTR